MIDIGANLAGRQFARDFDKVVEDAYAARVSHILVTGTSLKSSQDAYRLISNFNSSHQGQSRCLLYSTAGIHPHDAKTFKGDETLQQLKGLLDQDTVVAVGECGLDYDRMFSTRSDQLLCFDEQLRLERYYREQCGKMKPVFLHERKAHDDFIEKLRTHRPRGVVHCFTGSRRQVEEYLSLDMYIGITGWICDDRRNKELLSALPQIPLDRLLIETDAPYLAPNKGIKRNEPKYLPLVANKIAEVLQVAPEVVVRHSSANAIQLFQLA